MKIDFKTSNIVVQFVFKKMMLIWKRVAIVSCCLNCQCVIYVTLWIKSFVSGECCIRFYTVVSLDIGKENAYRWSKVLHESVAWNLLRYVILRVHPIIMRSHELHGISNHRQLDCLSKSYVTRPSVHGIPSYPAHMNICYKSLKPKHNLKTRTRECRSNVFWQIAFWHFNTVNTLMPKQSGRHFADDIFKCIFLNENVYISLNISLKFVLKVPIDNNPALVQIMTWRQPGDK